MDARSPVEEDVNALVEAIEQKLPDQAEWKEPDGYPDSLALCVLDSIWSIGVNYDHHVIPVLNRYREHRRAAGGDPASDGAAELSEAIDGVGGPREFADEVVRNHQRTSTRSGILKAEAVRRGAEALVRGRVPTTRDLRQSPDAVEVDWLKIPGQRSVISYRYLLILAGVERFKPDRMVLAFVNRAIDGSVDVPGAEALLTAALPQLSPSPTARQLDHAIWSYERERRRSGP